jgi:hypothetical protein
VAAVWWLVVLVAQQVSASPTVRLLALFVHLTSLVVGFGAVLTIDAYALLWLLGRRPVDEVARAASSVDLLVWLGLTGLVLSGVFLGPDTANPFTQTKLLLVLALGLNGVNLHALSRHTRALAATTAFRAAPRRYLLWAGASTAVSQVGWWGAVVIGFLNSSGRL